MSMWFCDCDMYEKVLVVTVSVPAYAIQCMCMTSWPIQAVIDKMSLKFSMDRKSLLYICAVDFRRSVNMRKGFIVWSFVGQSQP